MTNTLQAKIIVITGSTRGFGFAIAREALKTGASVAITGRSQEAVERALGELHSLGQTGRSLQPVSQERLEGIHRGPLEC